MSDKKSKYSEPGRCPECGSDNLDWHDSETYDNSMGYRFTCGDCEHEDEEIYNLEFAGFKSEYKPKLSQSSKQREIV